MARDREARCPDMHAVLTELIQLAALSAVTA